MTNSYEEKTTKKGKKSNKPDRVIIDDRITHFGQRLREANSYKLDNSHAHYLCSFLPFPISFLLPIVSDVFVVPFDILNTSPKTAGKIIII